MPRALIIGGTGLIGRAIARSLRTRGWSVDLAARHRTRVPEDLAGTRFHTVERDDPATLAAALGGGADLLVDCVCFTAAHATTLLPLARHATSTVMLSSKAVYVDDAGRHVNSAEPPRFDGPVTERQQTMAPGTMNHNSRDGYGANKVAAERVLLDSGLPVTVLRASKVHGEGAVAPREWYFVKRALDRRPVLLLAGRGAGVDHPTAAANIAGLVGVVAERPGARILNVADLDAPDGLVMSRVVAAIVGHDWREVLLGDDAPPDLGRHPWHRIPPIALDTGAARSLRFVPRDYASTVVEAVRPLVTDARAVAGDGAFAGWFDYGAEDGFLSAGR